MKNSELQDRLAAPYTPGPWRWNSTDASIWPTAGRRAPIATVFTAIDPLSEFSNYSDFFAPEEQANARLIAAAPTLLAALQEMVSLHAGQEHLYGLTSSGELLYRNCDERARAAIATATGGAK